MPRYDFKCRDCSAVFEAIVPFNVLTVPCVSCNPSEQAEPNFNYTRSIADRQLCVPAQIHIH